MPIRSDDYPRPSSVDATETADANPGEPREIGTRIGIRVVLSSKNASDSEILSKVRTAIGRLGG